MKTDPYHTHGKKLNTTQNIGKLRFFVPAHTYYIPTEDPRFKGQHIVNEINNKRLQEQLDDGTWIDVPTVCGI